jgi:endonuclease-8
VLTGRVVTRFECAYAQPTAEDDESSFAGQMVAGVEARGKWLLVRFGDGRLLATHMLMSGSWHIYRPGERWQAPRRDLRVLLETDAYLAVGFRIPVVGVMREAEAEKAAEIPKPERDVLSGEFDAAAAVERLRGRRGEALADVLLNQRVLAGVGNVFKSEICFLAGLSPFLPVERLTEAEARRVVELAVKLLAANVLEDSGDRVVTFQGRKRRTTRAANPGENLWVYGRRGEGCLRCGELVQRCLQGPNARVTYWCPGCQGVEGSF